MVIERITSCSRCGGEHENVEMTQFSGEKNPHYTHFSMCPTTNQPILVKVDEKEVKLYRKCWKCGRSAEITTNTPLTALMCTQPMAVRTSGICGGSYTEFYTKEEFEKEREEYLKTHNDGDGQGG
jgi:hypothetical protein